MIPPDRLVRKRRPTSDVAGNEPRFDGLVTAETRVALRELDVLLSKLSLHDRAALVLVAVEGLTVKEAAETLGVSEGAIEQRVVRARAALRREHSESEAADG